MSAVAKIEPREHPLAVRESSIDRIISAALDQNADLDRIEQLYALKRQYDADEARKAYVAAMARFKAQPLSIVKDKHVKFTTQKGTTEYDHATIGNVVKVICSGLGQEGFSHRWDTKQDAGKITVTCVITHEQGHSESTTLTASPDDSGGKNGIQSIASTVTYLQRYTLLAATGMATSEVDDDGRGGGSGGQSEDQRVELAWVEELSKVTALTGYAEVRQRIIDDYKGDTNIPKTLRAAMASCKRGLTQ